jgi:hypothetical protein
MNCDGTCVAAGTGLTVNLLANASFDDTPVGTGWIEMPIVSTSPLITPDDGVVEHSAPYKVWMGGISNMPPNQDSLYQDVTVPASTTQLVFEGYYEVHTAETGAATDNAAIELLTTSNAPLQVIKTLDNTQSTTAWTQIIQPITANVAGQTVRLRLRSANDTLNDTSFYFDTLELNATYCP